MSIKTLQVIYIALPPGPMPYCSDASDLLEKSSSGESLESSLKVPASSFLFQMPLLKLETLSPASTFIAAPSMSTVKFLGASASLSCQHLKSLYNEQYIHMNKNKTKLSAKYNFFFT